MSDINTVLNNNVNNVELLKYALENGMLDITRIQEQIEMNKRKELLDKHPYKMWQGKDGKWRTYLPDKEKGRLLKKRNTQQELESVIIQYWGDKEEDPTVEEIFKLWNEERYKKNKISNGTYERNIQFFERHYQEFGQKHIKELVPEDFENFLENELAEKKLSAKGFAGLKGITKGLITKAKREKLISYNGEQVINELLISINDFKKIKKEPENEVFNEKELPIIIKYLVNHLDTHNLGILLMFLTGIRVGELAALTHQDFHDNYITINKMERRSHVDNKYIYNVTENSKTEAGNRIVIVPDKYNWIIIKLHEINPNNTYIFTNKSGKRLNSACFRKRMYRICEKLGIKPKSPHKARKTYVSILLDNHVDLKMVQTIVGHTENSCTETSYHIDRKSLNTKMEVISSLPEFQVVK